MKIKYYIKTYILCIALFVGSNTYAQEIVNDTIDVDLEREIQATIDNESLRVFILKEVLLFNTPVLDTKEARRKYYYLKKRTRKVYPYAILASKRMITLEERLETIKSKRRRKKYIKTVYDYLKNEFEPTLKNFTQSEGRILIKLIYRQTGITMYDIAKEYRSGWSAFWYNTTASVFNLSLKSDYNPFKNKDDFMIESVLSQSFENGILEYESAFWEKLPYTDSFFDPNTTEK